MLPRSAEEPGVTALTRHRLLTADEEKALAIRMLQGDQKAKDELIQCNMRLVLSIAYKYMRHGLCLGDLVQEGTLGLIWATTKFDPAKGFRFSTYATHWIRQRIGRYAETGAPYRLPAHVCEGLRQIYRVIAILLDEGECPTPQLIAERMGHKLTPEKIKHYLEVSRPISLSHKVGENMETELQDLLLVESRPEYDPASVLQIHELQDAIEAILSCLTPRERDVLIRRFGLEQYAAQTLQEIGDEEGISRERIRQIELRAIKKVRRRAITNTELRDLCGR